MKEITKSEIVNILDKAFCENHPILANIMIGFKWNSIPNIMSKLADPILERLKRGF